MGKTASEAGWHLSRFNLSARIPDTDRTVIANLFAGTCGTYTEAELFLLRELPELDECHPILKRFSERGLIVRFDEMAALESLGRVECSFGEAVDLTICPTMSCNFDCPYCFESHRGGKMNEKTREDVLGLAERMLKTSGARRLAVTWFGGEPLLAPDVIESLSERLISLARRENVAYEASIITNGYLLTPSVAELLGRCGVSSAQVTLDGVGDTHDRTRRLTGGGKTFDRITENLRTVTLPFRVDIRLNAHEGNRDQIPELRAFVKKLAAESGNSFTFYTADVTGNEASNERGSQVRLLCETDAGDVVVQRDALRFGRGHGTYCGANKLYSIGIDECGNLHKCWEDADKTEHSFGSAARWDPADPIATSDHPDNLTRYLNTGFPFSDAECRDCVWLPACVGGCPNKRLHATGRQCLPYRNTPEGYVLALYERLKNGRE